MNYTFTINEFSENTLEFIKSHPKSNIFQTCEMYEVYKLTKKNEPFFIAVHENNGEVVGTLLAVIQKEHIGLIGELSARSIIWGGPLIKDNNSAVLDFLLKEYKRKIKRKAIYSQFRNIWGWDDDDKNIFTNNGFKYEAHLDILFDLKKSEDELLKEMNKGRRKNIRRAERIPLEFEEIKNDKDFDKCIQLIEQTYNRIKLPSPDKSFFYNTNFILKNINGLKVFVAKYKKEIISTRFVLCYNGLVYDWFAGTNDDFLVKNPNDFLPWKILQWAKTKGFATFDFGGAGKPNIPYGVRDYKLKFGGKLVEFGRFELIHKPLLMQIGKLGMNIYKRIK